VKFSRTQSRLAVATFSVGLAMGATMGLSGAASPSQTSCTEAGGTFTKVNGVVTCTVVDPVGNSEASGGKSQTRDTSDAEQGNLTPKNKNASTCTGPGNSKNC
jgi:hypothetical protein